MSASFQLRKCLPGLRVASSGEAKQVAIVILLVVSSALGVWTYWPQIQGLIFPKPALPIPSAPVAAPAPEPKPGSGQKAANVNLRTASPKLTLNSEKGSPAPVAKKETSFNLVEEPVADEPEGNLPEKLNVIKISEGDEMKRIEKQLVAKKKVDDASVIREYLGVAKISGVRVAGSMSKLILNGQIYQVGETVREVPKIIIQRVQSAKVVFEDAKGNQYPIKY